MIALAYLVFFLVYGWLSVRMVKLTMRWALASQKKAWLWGLVAGVFMYSLVFWDLIPTVMLHHYYCTAEGGFTQYKTLDQWKQEHPGVVDTLVANKRAKSIREGNRERHLLNQRFAWDSIRIDHPLHIRERDERIVDIETGEVLARYVDFDTDVGNPFAHESDRIRDFKWWMKMNSCEGGELPEQIKFNGYHQSVEILGE